MSLYSKILFKWKILFKLITALYFIFLFIIKMKRTDRNEFIKTSGQVEFMRWMVEMYGYSLEAAYVDERWEPRVFINKKDHNDRYLPRLQLDVEYNWKEMKVNSFEWTIETVSYGTKTTEEYKKLMDKMKDWFNCCKFLNEFNYSLLPVRPTEFED